MKTSNAIFLVILLACTSPLEAELYWDIDGATPGAGGATPNGTWGIDPFWSGSSAGDTATGAYVPNSDVVFSAGSDATGSYIVTLNGTQAANSLTFEEGAATLTGGTLLQIGAGGVSVTTLDATGATIASDTELMVNQTWTTTSGATLRSSGMISGAFNLIKAGTGTLNLSGPNTFSGGLTIHAGKVIGANAAALGTGTVTLGAASGSANVTLDGGVSGVITFTNAISVASGNTGVATISSSSSSVRTFSGPITLNTHDLSLAANNNSRLRLSGNVTGTGNLVLNNNSNLSNSLALSGASVNNSGTITNSGTGTGPVAISAAIGSNVTGIIQNSATSQLILSGTNTSFSGGIMINDGTVTGTTSSAFGTGTIMLGSASGNATLDSAAPTVTYTNAISVTSSGAGTATITNSQFGNVYGGLITLNSNNLRLFSSLHTVELRGGVTGVGNLIFEGPIVLSIGTIDNLGQITNSGTASITASIGANVTGVIQNSASQMTISGTNTSFNGGVTINKGTVIGNTSSAFGTGTITLGDTTGSADATLNSSVVGTHANAISVGSGNTGVATISSGSIGNVFSGPVALNTHGLSLVTNSNNRLTLSGGVTGTGDLVLNNNSNLSNSLILSGGGVNNSGTITNSGTGTEVASISADIGSNVTAITENSATSALTISGALTVNGGGTILTKNSGGLSKLTLSGGVMGTGNLLLNNNSASADGITLSGATVNNVGTIIHSGTNISGTVLISAVIGANVTGVIENSASSMTLSGTNTSFSGGVTINKGTVLGTTSSAFGTGTITLGDTTGSADATLKSSVVGTHANAISVASGNTGVAVISSSSTGSVFSGLVTLNSHDLRLSIDVFGGRLTLSGGTTGTGDLVLTNNSVATNGIALLGADVNHNGSIINSGIGSGSAMISATVGSNVTGVSQNSATSQLILSGANIYTGPTTVNAGTLSAGVASVSNVSGAFGNNSAVSLANVAGATLNLAGFNTQVGSLAGGGAAGGNVTLGSATLTTGGDNSSTAYAGVISGTGGLTKIGTGTQTLNGANAYTGATTVSVGTLIINGNHSAATGAVIVAAGATLGGSGTVGGATTVNGIHNPGNSAGLQTFTNGLTYNDATVNWELNTNAIDLRGTNFDGINVTGGNLTINGATTMNLVFSSIGSDVNWENVFWNANQQWTFYDAPSRIGAFTMGNVGLDSLGRTLDSVRPGAFFHIIHDGSGDVLLSYTAIPEPQVYALMGAFVFLLALCRRRRRAMQPR